MKKKILLLLAASTYHAVSAQMLPLDPAVRTGKLSNGFTYYVRHNEEPKKRAVFYLVNKVGSVLENDDQRGLAHFTEHMSFNGTAHFPKNELVDYLQKAGVRFGADINAYTSFDETVYQLPLPSDNAEIIKNGVEIMHDWAHGATLDPIEIDKERGVVLEEKRLGKGAADRMRGKYFPILLNNSRYASRIPIGTDEVIGNFKPETIKRFYHDWYRPDLQALIVVGDINVDEIEKTIKVKFADLKNPADRKPRTNYTIPLTGKNQFIVVTDPEMTSTTVQIVIKQPELSVNTRIQYRESIIRQLYNMMLSDRFNELQRQQDPPFLRGSAGIDGFMGGLDAYSISYTSKSGGIEKGFKSAWRENERVKRFGFTGTELDRAKIAYLNQFDSALKEKDRTPSESYVREYVQYFLHRTAAPGIANEYSLVKTELANIQIGDLNGLAKSAVKSTDRDILVMAPDKDKSSLPREIDFIAWMKAVETEDLKPFNDQTSDKNLLMTSPVPGKIMSIEENKKLGVTTLTLSNSIKVLLKNTNFRNNEILFSGFGPGGTSLYTDADYQSASAANLIPSYGAGNFSATELGKFLSGKQLSVQASIGERSQFINGGAAVSDLETSLQLMYAYMMEPRKDSSMFRGMINRSKSGLSNRSNDPNSVFQDSISAVLGNHSVRRTGPSLQKLDQIDINRAFTIYKERFANEQGFVFVFVGSIDVATIKPLIEKYIASLPATGNVVEPRDLRISIPPGVIEKKIFKGTEDKATVNLVFSGPFEYSMYNKQKLDGLKETLSLRLLERLREDESGVYSPSVRIATSKYPSQRYSLTVSFGCSPQNADKLTASTLDEIQKLKTAGPSKVNIDKFKSEDQRSMETSLQTNNFWLAYLINQLQNKDALDEIDSYSRKLDTISSDDIKLMASKYLSGKNYIRLVLLPENVK